eukprot:COSAG01_NODE_4353_length_5111_cov_52.320830_3_plen_221_part_00
MLATVGLVAFWYSATLLFNYTFFKLTRIKDDEAVKMVAQDITVIEMFTCTVLGVLTLYSKELPFVPVPAVRVRVLVVAVANAASCQTFAMAMDYINLSLVQTIRACQPICACESQCSIHTCDRSALSPVKHRHGVREGTVVRGNLTTLLRGCCTQSPSCWCTRSGVVRRRGVACCLAVWPLACNRSAARLAARWLRARGSCLIGGEPARRRARRRRPNHC